MVISKTRQFPPARKIGSVSGLALLSLQSRNHARFGLQTVFAITHSDHSNTPSSFNGITGIEMLTLVNVGLIGIAGLLDNSVALGPMLSYSFSDNAEDTYLNFYLGKEGTVFGTNAGHGGLITVRIYF